MRPVRPPIPASTSSKINVGMPSSRARIVLSASITRASSPPDATRASGRASWPTLSATRNSTSSAPVAAASLFNARCTRNRPSGMPRSGSRSSTAFARADAAACRFTLSRSAAAANAAAASATRDSSARMSSAAVSMRSSSARASRPAASTAAILPPCFFTSLKMRSRRRSTSSSRAGSSSIPSS